MRRGAIWDGVAAWRARAAILAVLATLFLAGCGNGPEGVYQGYVEGEFVYVASKIPGRLEELLVKRGDLVAPGQELYVLERGYEVAAVDQALALLARAEDVANDKRKGLRPEELDQIEATLGRARSQAELTALELGRRKKLFKEQTIAQEELDTVSTNNAADLATIRELEAKLATGKLPARIDQILAAEKDVLAARAALGQAQWNLDQKTQAAGVGGMVFDLLHYQGEWVAAGSPVLSLLPPENVKVRFFVPEAVAESFRPGREVLVNWDGAKKPAAARVSYVAPKVEYAPPVIYSQGFRQKLVIMIEVRFDPQTARTMNPGQPVDVITRIGEAGS